MSPFLLDGERLTLEDMERVARHREAVALDAVARPKIKAARHVIEAALAAGKPIYGVSTGFGPVSDVFVGAADREALKRNLLRSHAIDVGEPIGEVETRAILLSSAITSVRSRHQLFQTVFMMEPAEDRSRHDP